MDTDRGKPAQAPAERSRRLPPHRIILALILLVSAGLRLYHITGDSLWYDELCSLELSAGHGMAHYLLPTQQVFPAPPNLLSLDRAEPSWRLWTSLELDFHPPLYYLALRAWRHVAGSSDLAVRLLSVLAGIAATALIYDVARLAHNRVAGLWSAAIFAFANPQIHFAQETRMYMLLVALALGGGDALLRIERLGPSRTRLIALFAASLGMMLTNYLGILVAAALGCYALVRLLQGKSGFRSVAFLLLVSAALYLLIWGPFLWQQRQAFRPETQTALYSGDNWSVGDGLKDLVDVPIELIAAPITQQSALGRVSLIVLLLPLLVLRRQPTMLLWLFWLAGTLLVMALFSEIKHAHPLRYDRYVLIAGPPIYMILAAILSDRRQVLRHIIPAAAVVMALMALPAIYRPGPFAGLDRFIHSIDQMAGEGDVIAFCSDGQRDWISGHALAYRRYGNSPERPIVILHGPARPELLEQLARFPGVIAVVNAPKQGLETFVPGYRVAAHRNEWPHASILRMERRTPASRRTWQPLSRFRAIFTTQAGINLHGHLRGDEHDLRRAAAR